MLNTVFYLEPSSFLISSEVEEYYSDKTSVQDLADAYAISSNHFWWVEDNVYDYEEGTPEYKEACAIADGWWKLVEKYKKSIFEILKSEGIDIPEKGHITVLSPFMKKYGYEDSGGWWTRE